MSKYDNVPLLSLKHSDAAYTEEDEWSDEFDDDADEATAGMMNSNTQNTSN